MRGARVVHEPRPGAALGGGGAPVEQQLLRLVHDQSGPLDRRGVGHRDRIVPQRVERRLVARIVFPTTAPREVLVGHDEHVPRLDTAAQGRPVRKRVRVEALEAYARDVVFRRGARVARPGIRPATPQRRRERAERRQPLIDDVPGTRHEGRFRSCRFRSCRFRSCRSRHAFTSVGRVGRVCETLRSGNGVRSSPVSRVSTRGALEERGGDDRLSRARRVRDQTAARERRHGMTLTGNASRSRAR